MRVGSLPWLLRHEWRIWCRDPKGLPLLMNAMKPLPACIFLLFVCMIVFDIVSPDLQHFRQHLAQHSETGLGIAISVWGFLFLFTLMDNFNRLYTLLEKPLGLDLVASSPLGAQRFFMMQLGKLTVTMLISDAFIFFIYAPFTVIVTHSLKPAIGLAITLILQALLCSSLAMWMGLGPARWFGIKRAALFVRSTFIVLVLIFYVGLAGAWLLHSGIVFQNLLWQLWQQSIIGSSWWGLESWLWLPARTLLVDPQAIFLTTILSVGLFGFSVWRLPMAFIEAVQQPHLQRRRAARRFQKRFMKGAIANILLKEWRLILRSPQLWLSSLILGCFWTVIIPGFQHLPDPILPSSSIAPTAFFTFLWAILLTIIFTQHCLIQEQDTWLRAVPISSQTLHLSKLLAVLLLLWCCVFIPIGVSIQMLHSPGILMIVLLIPATTIQAILTLWNACPLHLAPQSLALFGLSRRDERLAVLEFVALCNWASIAMLAHSQS